MPVLTILLALCGAGERDEPKFTPTTRYETRTIEGWDVLVGADLLRDEPVLAERTLTLLRHQLYQITRVVPSAAVEKLRKVRIWVEEEERHHPCMAYHPDAGWLRAHDMNPEKARCVEVANARNFLKWTKDQPWMVLHELAHAYHHQFLPDGFDNADVRDAHREAVAAKAYDSVLRINGDRVAAYAATNPMEYFAEGTEALLGTNDFYPFVRAELRQHDPRLHDLLRKAWGVE